MERGRGKRRCVCGPHHVVSECGWNRRAGKQSQTEDSSASDDARTADQAGRTMSLFCGRLSQSHYQLIYALICYLVSTFFIDMELSMKKLEHIIVSDMDII